MRKFLSIAVVVLFAAGLVFGSGGRRAFSVAAEAADPAGASAAARAPEPPKEDRRKIDWKADFAGPVKPGDSVIFLVGNFAAQHNGALIACDSAVQHSERHWEFFGNVLINKNTTYIYGDRADYDGDLNEARVYSDLIKVVDGDATLYTFRFVYNTQSNIGEFSGGGMLINGENRLESQRGYYFGDERLLASVDEVQMRNEEYALKGDSVVYDLATDDAYFFERTNIWNRDGDYLYADRGSYRNTDTTYFVTRNGYLLTEKQEIWSDSIDYFRPIEYLILRHDLQIDDTEHQSLTFGDYGEYWQDPGDAFLTRRPVVVSYDTSQGDTLYMRSDSIYLYTINRLADARRVRQAAIADSIARQQAAERRAADPDAEADSEAAEQGAAAENGPSDAADPAGTQPRPNQGNRRETMHSDSLQRALHGLTDTTAVGGFDAAAGDPDAAAADSLAGAGPIDSLRVIDPLDTLTGADRKAYLAELKRQEQAARKAAAAAAKKVQLDSIAARRRANNIRKLEAQRAKEEARAEVRRQKAIARINAARARAARKGRTYGKVDPKVLAQVDSVTRILDAQFDSLLVQTDSLLRARQLAAGGADSLAAEVVPDSIYRLVKGFRDVRIYRTDFQVVCDSITAISTDSTLHLYIDPVLWNENNQITSDSVTAYTVRQQIVRAEFFGSPIMSSQLDTTYYNQIKGKTMTAYFRDNEIYRNDVVGNAQTIYYMTDGEPPAVTTMGVIESGDLSFYFEEKELVQMTWRANPDYKFYPIIPEFQVPASQSLYLDGFHWEGHRRPTKRDVFDRTIRPSEREMRSRLPQPDFPISRRIEAFKQRLIERRQWVDRNDPVDPATVEWMHDLGYEVNEPHPDYRRQRPAATLTEAADSTAAADSLQRTVLAADSTAAAAAATPELPEPPLPQGGDTLFPIDPIERAVVAERE